MHMAGRHVPNLVPSLPNLCFEVGNPKALQIGRVPNLPNVPNLSAARAYTYTRARPCVCVTTNKGWEGWEGWEEVAVVRFFGSQPVFVGWEGWEQGWETQEVRL